MQIFVFSAEREPTELKKVKLYLPLTREWLRIKLKIKAGNITPFAQGIFTRMTHGMTQIYGMP
jgi:hypothetical protein